MINKKYGFTSYIATYAATPDLEWKRKDYSRLAYLIGVVGAVIIPILWLARTAALDEYTRNLVAIVPKSDIGFITKNENWGAGCDRDTKMCYLFDDSGYLTEGRTIDEAIRLYKLKNQSYR